LQILKNALIKHNLFWRAQRLWAGTTGFLCICKKALEKPATGIFWIISSGIEVSSIIFKNLASFPFLYEHRLQDWKD
jgi:hypothetical protein